MAIDTALNIISDSAVELGLVKRGSLTDAFGSSDANIGQLCQLLKSVGRDLVRVHQWTALQNIWVFSTDANIGRYALPDDYDRVIDQTAWNRSNRLPLGGPISPQAFEFMQARLVGISWNLLWRVLQGKFQAYPADTTPGGYVIAYEYVSKWWVRPVGTNGLYSPWMPNVGFGKTDYCTSGGNVYQCQATGTTGTTAALAGQDSGITDGTCTWNWVGASGTDAPTANGDTIQLDAQLVRAALKRAWKAEKGMDVTAAEADYQSSLEKALNADIVAPILYFNRPSFSEPLLGPWNLPINGTTT